MADLECEQCYTLDEVAEHNEKDDAWIALDGIVYDISDYLEDPANHPGGTILISEFFGKDISVMCDCQTTISSPRPPPLMHICCFNAQPAWLH